MRRKRSILGLVRVSVQVPPSSPNPLPGDKKKAINTWFGEIGLVRPWLLLYSSGVGGNHMEKLTQGMKKLWRDPLALIFMILIITLLIGKSAILLYELVIVNLIFFGLLFYFSWLQPKKLIHYFSTYEGFFKFASLMRKRFGDLNESGSFIPLMRFCAVVGLLIFSRLLYKIIQN